MALRCINNIKFPFFWVSRARRVLDAVRAYPPPPRYHCTGALSNPDDLHLHSTVLPTSAPLHRRCHHSRCVLLIYDIIYIYIVYCICVYIYIYTMYTCIIRARDSVCAVPRSFRATAERPSPLPPSLQSLRGRGRVGQCCIRGVLSLSLPTPNFQFFPGFGRIFCCYIFDGGRLASDTSRFKVRVFFFFFCLLAAPFFVFWREYTRPVSCSTILALHVVSCVKGITFNR